MRLEKIDSVNYGLNKTIKLNRHAQPGYINLNSLKADTISFSGKDTPPTAKQKMVNYIYKVLNEDVKLKPDQPLKIIAPKEQVPFVNLMMKEAYKMGSGEVVAEIIEPELEQLKQKYHAKDFDWKEKRKNRLKEQGAAFVNFDSANSPYKQAGLTDKETKEIISSMKADIPARTLKKLVIPPEDILEDKLHIKKGQPLFIRAEREHESNVLKLVEYAYKKGAGPIDVMYSEDKQHNFVRTKIKYASDKVLKAFPQTLVDQYQEYIDKNAARSVLSGADPTLLSDLDSKRINDYNANLDEATNDLFNEIIVQNPWNLYYAPTTKSAPNSYTEYKNDPIKALDCAANDVAKINRVGKSVEHLTRLKKMSEKVNDLIVNKGLETIRFTSIDPKTGKPDNKTKLDVGLSSKSRFTNTVHTTAKGQTYAANTPAEEVFSTPDRNKVNGTVYATRPLVLSGKVIEEIKMEFKDGKIARDENNNLKVYAKTNQDFLRDFIEKHKNADRLGEVSMVAGSPIFDLGRVFKNTLLDENAGCHLALGNGYPYCFDGSDKYNDPKERKEYLKKHNFNFSTTHNDFIIGGPNVVVEGVTKDGKVIPLIKDNKFQI